MRLSFSFNRLYFRLAVTLFVVEVFIALFVKDGFVRPYLGDVLVVILLYCFVRSFLFLPVLPLALSVLLFSFIIEYLQYIRFVELVGLEDSVIMRTVLGTSFAWNDMLAYSAGIVVVITTEFLCANAGKEKRSQQKS